MNKKKFFLVIERQLNEWVEIFILEVGCVYINE